VNCLVNLSHSSHTTG